MRNSGFLGIHPVAGAVFGSIVAIALVGAPLIGQNIAKATKISSTSPEVSFDLVLYQVDAAGALQEKTTDQGLSLDDCVRMERYSHPIGTVTLVTCRPGIRPE